MQEAETVAYAEHVKNEDVGTGRKKHTQLIIIVVGLVLIATIIGVVVGVTLKDSSSSNGNTAPAVVLDPCEDDPDVLTQCRCNSSIYYLTVKLQQRHKLSGINRDLSQQ